jgi:hypothetical protein
MLADPNVGMEPLRADEEHKPDRPLPPRVPASATAAPTGPGRVGGALGASAQGLPSPSLDPDAVPRPGLIPAHGLPRPTLTAPNRPESLLRDEQFGRGSGAVRPTGGWGRPGSGGSGNGDLDWFAGDGGKAEEERGVRSYFRAGTGGHEIGQDGDTTDGGKARGSYSGNGNEIGKVGGRVFNSGGHSPLRIPYAGSIWAFLAAVHSVLG